MDEKESRERRGLRSRETDVAFKCATLRARANYRKPLMLHVVTLRSIKTLKALLVERGMKYFV